MTTFYGLPNDHAFWHWPTLIHFVLVALAGGMALVAAIRTWHDDDHSRLFALTALVLIVMDFGTLWLESSARFRLTHIWLFLSFRPTAYIWWGAMGLTLSAVMAFLISFQFGPKRLWAAIMTVSATVILLYPGVALAANSARPLWTPLLLAFFPLTSLLIVLGIGQFKWDWAKPYFLSLSVLGAVFGAMYLIGLAFGGLEAQDALHHFWMEGGLFFSIALLLMLSSPVALKRFPALAGLMAVVGAILARSLIIEIGQYQGLGF